MKIIQILTHSLFNSLIIFIIIFSFLLIGYGKAEVVEGSTSIRDNFSFLTLPYSLHTCYYYEDEDRLVIGHGGPKTRFWFFMHNEISVTSPHNISAVEWYPYVMKVRLTYDLAEIYADMTMYDNNTFVWQLNVKNLLNINKTFPFVIVYAPDTHLYTQYGDAPKGSTVSKISYDPTLDGLIGVTGLNNIDEDTIWIALTANMSSVAHACNESLADIKADFADGLLSNTSMAYRIKEQANWSQSLFGATQYNLTIPAKSNALFLIAITFSNEIHNESEEDALIKVKNATSTTFDVSYSRNIWNEWFSKVPRPPEGISEERWYGSWFLIFSNLIRGNNIVGNDVVLLNAGKQFGNIDRVWQHDTPLVAVPIAHYYPDLAKGILRGWLKLFSTEMRTWSYPAFPHVIYGNIKGAEEPVAPYVFYLYYTTTGDKELIKEAYPGLEKYMQWFINSRYNQTARLFYTKYLEEGTLDETTEGNFLFWGHKLPTPFCEVTLNAYMYKNFQVMKFFAELSGNSTAVEYWKNWENLLYTSINDKLWNGTYYFTLDKNLSLRTDIVHEGALHALAVGVVPPEREKMVIDFAKNSERKLGCKFYFDPDYIVFLSLYSVDGIKPLDVNFAFDIINERIFSGPRWDLAWHGSANILAITWYISGLKPVEDSLLIDPLNKKGAGGSIRYRDIDVKIQEYNVSNPLNPVIKFITVPKSKESKNINFTIGSLAPSSYYTIKRNYTYFTTAKTNEKGYLVFGSSEWSTSWLFIVEKSDKKPLTSLEFLQNYLIIITGITIVLLIIILKKIRKSKF